MSCSVCHGTRKGPLLAGQADSSSPSAPRGLWNARAPRLALPVTPDVSPRKKSDRRGVRKLEKEPGQPRKPTGWGGRRLHGHREGKPRQMPQCRESWGTLLMKARFLQLSLVARVTPDAKPPGRRARGWGGRCRADIR